MKIRRDFVTNSSSSSFILAFKNKKDAYAAICEAFLKYHKSENESYEDDDDEYYCNESFDENACALDNILIAMEGNQLTAEQVIDYYIESISWYSVRHKIDREIWNDPDNYPRKDAADFKAKYESLIEQRRDEKLTEIRDEMEKWLADKKYITRVDFEDHWPESQAHDICSSIDGKNMKSIRE